MNWFEQAIETLADGRDQGCEAGHEWHELITAAYVVTPEVSGRMTVFDPFKYAGTAGYCPGDDCVSRTIAFHKQWEPIETAMVLDILNRYEGAVIDFGTQVGWYTMIATKLNRDVLAIEGVSEHMTITRANSKPDYLWQAHHWVTDTTPVLDADGAPPIALVKMDLEGSERHAVRCISALLDADLVANILMEVSPVFNDSYPQIVGDLLYRGFTGIVCSTLQEVTTDNYEDVIALEPQVDMLFTRGL